MSVSPTTLNLCLQTGAFFKIRGGIAPPASMGHLREFSHMA